MQKCGYGDPAMIMSPLQLWLFVLGDCVFVCLLFFNNLFFFTEVYLFCWYIVLWLQAGGEPNPKNSTTTTANVMKTTTGAQSNWRRPTNICQLPVSFHTEEKRVEICDFFVVNNTLQKKPNDMISDSTLRFLLISFWRSWCLWILLIPHTWYIILRNRQHLYFPSKLVIQILNPYHLPSSSSYGIIIQSIGMEPFHSFLYISFTTHLLSI